MTREDPTMTDQPLMNASTGRLSTWTGKDPAGKSQTPPMADAAAPADEQEQVSQDGAEKPPTP
jgi:hypothetical protein